MFLKSVHPLLLSCLGAVALAALSPNLAHAAQEPQPETIEAPFLIPSVQVWQGPGQELVRRGVLVLDDREVVFLDGPTAPSTFPEARIWEADENDILYPGLLHGDFRSGLGTIPDNPYQSTASDPREGPIPAMEYGSHVSFAGHLYMSDYAEWNDDPGKAWRELGFSSAILAPSRGLVQGHGSQVAFNGLPLAESLLRRDGPQLLSLRGSGGYPQTAMAALAVHRQLLLDQGRGDLSPDLVLGKRRIFRANSPRAIENILDLHRDFETDAEVTWVILGGHGARAHQERLKQQGIGVLYEISMEDALDSEEDLELNDAEERNWWQDPLRMRDEQRRMEAEEATEFADLLEAGVACALVPHGKSSEVFEQIERMVELGLDSEQALLAMSQDAAQLFGIEGGTGGYFLSRGPFSFSDHQITATLSLGRLFSYPPEEAGDEEDDEEGGEAEDDANALDGHWSMLVETPMGDEEFGIFIQQADMLVEIYDLGKPDDADAAEGVGIKNGNQVKFDFQVPEPEMEVTVFLKLKDGNLDGKMKTPFGDVPIFGERPDGQSVAKSAPQPKKGEESSEESEEEEEQGDGLAQGHPQWPVEIEADRLPHSDWALAREGTVLFRNATLYTMTGEEPEVGDLLIENGVITGVGGTQAAPSNGAVVDAEGWHLMPGIIDAHSHLALDAINEGSMTITAACRVGDMIRPHDVGIFRAAAGGTATVLSLHGSANPIGGQAATWTLDYQQRAFADLLTPEAPRNIKFALGENVKQSNWDAANGRRFPNSRLGVDAVYRRAFTAAQDYAEARRLAADGQRPNFRRDVRLEVLADILDNVVHVQCHSYRADELLMFLEVCREFGIEGPTFQHVLEGYKVAPEMAAAGAMASTFSDWWAYKFEVRDAIPWNVEILHKAGVVVSINSDSDEMIRRLNTEAAKAQRYGNLNWQEAMATCTINSAKQLRLEDRLGTLEVGKDGTISIFDAPPLSTYSRCRMTLARGIALYEFDPASEQRWLDYMDAAKSFAQAQPMELNERIAEDTEDWSSWTKAGQGHAYWISGATVHTPGEEPFVGTLHVKDGRIEQLYRGRTAMPKNMNKTVALDARGMNLYPGFIDALDRTGLFEIAAVRSSRDDRETGQDQPDLSAAVAIHADSAHHHVTRLNGVAYVLTRPDFGRIRGRGALIQLEGTTTHDMIAVPNLGMFIRFPMVGRNFDIEDGPEEPEDLAELNEWFDRAEAYQEQLDRYAAAGRAPLHRDPRLEALLPCLSGEQKVFLEAEDAPTLMAARTWAKERGLRAVFVGGRDAWKVAGYFGADEAELILGSVHRLPRSRFDPHDSPFRVAGLLDQVGCRVALSTNDPETTRNLPYQAATAAAWGWSQDRALAAITIEAARILEVDRYIGSIEEGKVATFFLTAGDPMDLEIGIERMWIGGKEVPLTSHQTGLHERYLDRLEPSAR
jgi:imidazolonepropionase-like amidohydrolase